MGKAATDFVTDIADGYSSYLSGSRTSLRVLSQKRLRTSLRVFETYSAS
jgi:hypothetical protein